MENNINHLIGLCETNVQKCHEILLDLTKMLNNWNSQDDKGNFNFENLNIKLDPIAQTAADPEEYIATYMDRRNQLFAELRECNDKITHVQRHICSALGLKEFRIDRLRPYVEEDLLVKLDLSLDKLLSYMQEIQIYDSQLRTILEYELQATKLEMHRLRGGQKVRQAYGQPNPTDANFIDINK